MATTKDCVFNPRDPPMGIHGGFHAACHCGWLGKVHITLVGAEMQWKAHRDWMAGETTSMGGPQREPEQTGQQAQCHVCGNWVGLLKKGIEPKVRYQLQSHRALNECDNVAISPDGRDPIFRIDEEVLHRRTEEAVTRIRLLKTGAAHIGETRADGRVFDGVTWRLFPEKMPGKDGYATKKERDLADAATVYARRTSGGTTM